MKLGAALLALTLTVDYAFTKIKFPSEMPEWDLMHALTACTKATCLPSLKRDVLSRGSTTMSSLAESI